MAINLPQYKPKLAITGKIKNGLNVPVLDGQGNQAFYDSGKKKMRPKQLDHFLVTTNARDENDNLVVDGFVMKQLHDAHLADPDGKIRRIPVLVHSDDIEEVFPTTLLAYKGKGLACRGDGEKAERWTVERGARIGASKPVSCPCPWLTNEPKGDDPICKGHGALRVSIALPTTITLGSIYEYRTTSVISIPKISGALMHVQSEIGTLVGTPMWLVLRPELVTPKGQAQKTVYSSFLELRGSDLIQLQQAAVARVQAAQSVQRIAGRRELLGLPAPSEESDEEAAAIAAEFHVTDDEIAVAGRDYDPATGEVFDKQRDPSNPQQSAAKAGPKPSGASSSGAGATQAAGVTPPSTVSQETKMAPDDPARREIANLLTKLAKMRGIDDANMGAARKEILAEVTTSECGQAIVYGDLTATTGFKVARGLQLMIKKREILEQGESGPEPEPEAGQPEPADDEIPA